MKTDLQQQILFNHEDLCSFVRYDNKTGKLFLKKKTSKYSRAKIGSEIGGNYPGYKRAKFAGGFFYVHRLVWFFNYGKWPEGQIDHINGNKRDNRIENLRDVTNKENCRNIKLPKTNTSGHIGVVVNKTYGGWTAQIHVDGHNKNLGTFGNKEEAIAVRKEAEIKYGFHENHGRS